MLGWIDRSRTSSDPIFNACWSHIASFRIQDAYLFQIQRSLHHGHVLVKVALQGGQVYRLAHFSRHGCGADIKKRVKDEDFQSNEVH
jgi:hypothetical protein